MRTVGPDIGRHLAGAILVGDGSHAAVIGHLQISVVEVAGTGSLRIETPAQMDRLVACEDGSGLIACATCSMLSHIETLRLVLQVWDWRANAVVGMSSSVDGSAVRGLAFPDATTLLSALQTANGAGEVARWRVPPVQSGEAGPSAGVAAGVAAGVGGLPSPARLERVLTLRRPRWPDAVAAAGGIAADGGESTQQSWDWRAGRNVDTGVHEITLWDLASGERRLSCLGHSARVCCLQLMPREHTLVSGSDDGTVRLWDSRTGAQMRRLCCGHGYVKAVAVRGLVLFSAGWDTQSGAKTVRVWDASTGRRLATLPELMAMETGRGLASLSVTRSRILYPAAASRRALVWDVELPV